MTRSYRRPYQLANLVGQTAEEVLFHLRALGIPVADENSLIPKNELARVLKALSSLERTGLRKPDIGGGNVERTAAQRRTRLEKAEPVAELPPVRRKLVGHRTADMEYLSAADVEGIHWCLVDDFSRSRDPIDPPGIRDRHLLESAVFRVHTALGSELKYPTIPMAAAAYLHSIIQNHVFHNGNKRTALVVMLVFLDINGLLLEVDQDQLFDYIMQVSSHGIVEQGPGLADREVIGVAQWVHVKTRPLSKREHLLKFHELRAILSDFDCAFEQPKKGNRINISREDRRTQVFYRNEGADVERNTVHKIRQDLGLSEQDGYDSTIFYNSAARIPDFIQKYRRTLYRLAKE